MPTTTGTSPTKTPPRQRPAGFSHPAPSAPTTPHSSAPSAPGNSLASLLHDGELLTPEVHASCPGRGVYFRSYDLVQPIHYCTGPAAHGHTPRYASTPAPGDAREPAPPQPPSGEPPDPSRRIVIEGNKAWAAATEVRRRWLPALFARRTTPRELAQFIAGQLLTMPEPVRSGLARAPGQVLFSQLTGHQIQDWRDTCAVVPPGRLPLMMFAPIATAFEAAMGEGEGRSTWRTDRYSPCPREQAAAYLTLLTSLGYQPSLIEQAVAEQRPYTGETPPGQTVLGDDDDPGHGTEGAAPGTGDGAEPDAGHEQDADSGEPAGWPEPQNGRGPGRSLTQ